MERERAANGDGGKKSRLKAESASKSPCKIQHNQHEKASICFTVFAFGSRKTTFELDWRKMPCTRHMAYTARRYSTLRMFKLIIF